MNLIRFFAGCIDRAIVLFLFVVFVIIIYGEFASSGYIGRYYGGAVKGRVSYYDRIDNGDFYNKNRDRSDVSTYFIQESNKKYEFDGYMNMQTIDNKLTFIFLLCNLFYFSISNFFFRSSLGELLFGISFVNENKKHISLLSALCRVLVYMLIIAFMIIVRYFLNSTYLNVSIMLLMINWIIIIYKGQSLVDLLTFTRIKE